MSKGNIIETTDCDIYLGVYGAVGGVRFDVFSTTRPQMKVFANLTNAEAHELAQWILDNVEEPDPLPTEFGLYQIVQDSDSSIEHEVTYRHASSRGWVNALENDSVNEYEMNRLKKAAKNGTLVRLIREEKK